MIEKRRIFGIPKRGRNQGFGKTNLNLTEEGVNLLPVLSAKKPSIDRPEPLFWFWSKKRAIREGDWKLVWLKKRWELYNLKNDRTETQDLSAQHPEKVAELARQWEDWAELTDVKY